MKEQIIGRYFLIRVSRERLDRTIVNLQGAILIGEKNHEAPLHVELTSEGTPVYCAALYNAFADDFKYRDRFGPTIVPEYEIVIRKKQGS
jgi:hypothetical protein